MRECLNEARIKIIGFMRDRFKAAGLSFEEEEAQELMDGIEESIWNELESYRSLTEVQQIVDCVRAGHEMNVPYYDPEIDDDPYIVRPKW